MSPSIIMIYQSKYEALIQRRAQLIAEIEQINNNIFELLDEAKMDLTKSVQKQH